MSNAPVDHGRRRFLTIATSVVGGVGAVGAAVPFIASWNPSEKAKQAGAAVTANIGKLEPGQLIRVEWRGKPVWVVNRTPEMLETLKKVEPNLRDPASDEPQQPAYAKNQHRSKKPEIFVAVGICTHLGCSPTYKMNDFDAHVEGVASGFFCPCHGSTYDMAGRVFSGVPAPKNLMIPPYMFSDGDILTIGADEGTA
ncbi:MAG: ubiquinol-cytochrome c reductase iron-sulfur subunit [Gammaproteobacteria bacterium]|jgi:ubiquinol-cytochrome c reductase iron-sulfur subunit|nr:ubiquinol-cytochrome c reductase iron-sulfur subunit [Gammaproteobacteria bacterium]MBU2178058.1 ubiquinol-cytochrome c reductase iron-sulfur subunit [Gammaproteobacteria bacterium]MBU2224196.1 ubiquinol-cytochrome c reductase iron-sulfur subunit [Gammaproteobacteria bacterium]MBU2279345.1 ubiquinol-cytochrome c reductase iron-sulfur subunit [Gammaproteobacteria bacterium]MBU2425783.1 ubiquinol-cytochrome c reductase iron-sulfur subunit [Gammaproteobacteria bacterium]